MLLLMLSCLEFGRCCWMDELTDEQKGEQTDKLTNVQTDERTDEQTDSPLNLQPCFDSFQISL